MDGEWMWMRDVSVGGNDSKTNQSLVHRLHECLLVMGTGEFEADRWKGARGLTVRPFGSS